MYGGSSLSSWHPTMSMADELSSNVEHGLLTVPTYVWRGREGTLRHLNQSVSESWEHRG